MTDSQLVILDCTIRDGNYAVNFKFTENDTRLLTEELARLGFKWIEVGHGLGLGAEEAGKGSMPARDIDLIRAARRAAQQAKIGMFCIPGLARMEHLEMARDNGLDFIRIGENAPEAARTFPYLKRARELGMIPCLNLMKSYAVTPEQFAEVAKGGVEAGAEVIYCVDSAGSMFPDDVAKYFDATRAVVDCHLGFHGHNNLMLAISNCLAAYQHGARYIDTTLCGLGRSAGNAPTEILVALLERMGIPTGLDLFAIMDVIELYMWPLVAQTRPHDMLGVTAGYSQFHSSFLPPVVAAAQKYSVELRRLVAKVALHDAVNLDKAYLEQAAQELAQSKLAQTPRSLVGFSAPGISRSQISHSVRSVESLIEGLAVTSNKRGGVRPVLLLTPMEKADEELVETEFVMEDNESVIGRVTYGSWKALDQALALAENRVFMFLVNTGPGWAAGAERKIARKVGAERVVPVREPVLLRQFITEMLDRAAVDAAAENLFLYCPPDYVLEALETESRFEQVFIYGAKPAKSAGNTVTIENLDDWSSLNLRFGLILCGSSPTEPHARILGRALAPQGRVLSLDAYPTVPMIEHFATRLRIIDPGLAYAGFVSRCLATERVWKSTPVAEA